ncbi:MAG: L-histidine N(alpha)-methyltransferase [Burkholderiales bacterium]|nr:L-histidine N(alpha)-methyltransferase [Burkholderiales bacterium]
MDDERVSFHDFHPDADGFLDEVIAGLSRPQKELNPKFLYDARGCELFDAICELPEYYPTRTEMAMMREHAAEMAQCLGPGCVLIEYGSGTSRKTRELIAALDPEAYVPIDIADGQLRASAQELADIFPALRIIAVCADYSRPLVLPEMDGMRARRRAIYFPGSTIGNFTTRAALEFLRRACMLAGPGGAMLVGVDLKKDATLLHAAYNDAEGVTAEFNLNLLVRINRELGADFDLSAFRHHAFYNAPAGRVEMHLRSMRGQQVTVGGRVFRFAENETIHTENSCKYSLEEFRRLSREAGFDPVRCWTDPGQLFAVHYLVVPG